MKTKYLYINTIGCQMNVYDSEQIANGLKSLQYEMTPFLEKADLIIVNTCAIREKAEQKVFSFLGRLAGLKKKKPDLIIGVGGCVAQQEGAKILERLPYLDLVFGTHAIDRLPDAIQAISSKKCRIVDTQMSDQIKEMDFSVNGYDTKDVTRFVTIMQGCDNYCTYCVVPYVRGRETSRDPENIIYGMKEGLLTFPELLRRVNDIDGLLRIRFTTSHPKDLSENLIHAFKDLDKLCHHIHLPIQSGSNRILKRMNRKYTREIYLEKVEKLRNTCPDIAITSDIIVGFPGETRTDFQETLDLIGMVEFDGLFAFKYSDRPNASAARFSDKILEDDKKQRLQEVLDLQDQITTRKNKTLKDSIQSVLVEGFSKKQNQINIPKSSQNAQWTGRTSTNKIVNFYSNDDTDFCNKNVMGQLVNVRILKTFSHSLWGETNGKEPIPFGLRGEKSYVA
jgi:tRNA-2-methylthio-N6-dimethylallyladenosine synthase